MGWSERRGSIRHARKRWYDFLRPAQHSLGRYVQCDNLMDHVYLSQRYAKKMLDRGRIITIESDQVECVLFFFLINFEDKETYVNRPMWTCPEDTESGTTIFIDKMICRKWTVGLRKALEDAIVAKYPHVTDAFWLREPKNRHVIIKRGSRYVHS